MAKIEKMIEFAANGEKNTDELNQINGFPASLKPARQWFNFLFNSLTKTINQIIDEKLDKNENAESASKLKTQRTVSFSGAATGEFVYDGSEDSSCVLTLVDSGIDPTLYSPIPWPSATPPIGYLAMMGQSISEAVYPELFALYGPVLPDMRGEFIRGWDNARGVDSGRVLLSTQKDEFKTHNHPRQPDPDFVEQIVGDPGTTQGDLQGTKIRSRAAVTTGNSGGAETRPRNIAFNYIVKAG